MTLRRCIDGLRKNQTKGTSEPIPYRSSKITHLFRNFFELLGGVKLVICINPCGSEFDENWNVLQFAEAAQNIVCKREIKAEFDAEDIIAKSEEAAAARQKAKIRRRTIFEPWQVKEEELEQENILPDLELYDFEDSLMMENLVDCLKSRIGRRDIISEETNRLSLIFKKKLIHYERSNVEAFGKLKVISPQLTKNEDELDKVQKENKKLEKKNRALMETQRVYEVDRKEKEADLAQKDQLLKRTTAAQNRKAMEDKRKNEDYKRKVQLETERKMAESTSRSSRELRERDDKLSRLKVE